MTTLNPYISFDGTTADAMAFYQSVLGGDLTSSSFDEFGISEDPADAGKIMHAQLVTDGGLTLMAADAPAAMPTTAGNNVAISLSGDDEAELRGYFDGLSAGGTVSMPFATAPWGDVFGMFTDRFGINWLVDAVAPQG